MATPVGTAGTLYSTMSTYSRFNLDEDISDIQIFVNDYRRKVYAQLAREQSKAPSPFISFHENLPETPEKKAWLKDNQDRFFKDSPNKFLKMEYYLSEMGFITSMIYSPAGEFVIVGHSTGLIQMRHGHTGTVLATLRNIQFPAKPVYSLEYSRSEARVCYAACTDGAVYRIEIPFIDLGENAPEYCIRADPALEWLNTQFYTSPGASMCATPFISQRTPALSLGITADSSRMVVGFADTSVKVYDMETQDVEQMYKVHKLRMQFIPKKLQRMHFGQVCAVRCHDEKPYMFATAGWDNTLRIWDIRCKVGCMMTFEGVKICHDAIDLNRDEAISGSWQTTEALCTWDLVARKRLNIIRVQNRRPDVDGEYIYACRYWRSGKYNRKGKYGIIGGSGTGCVEVINLHNRYITCSYPAPGTILAIASFDDRIAFGGTSPVFNIVSFHDPKHEKYKPDITPPYDYTEHPVTLFERYDIVLSPRSSDAGALEGEGESYEDEVDEEKLSKTSQAQMSKKSQAEVEKKSQAAMKSQARIKSQAIMQSQAAMQCQTAMKYQFEMGKKTEAAMDAKSRGDEGFKPATFTDISNTRLKKSMISTLPGEVPPPKKDHENK